ncbi:MFS transporter [Streptomyces sp. NPDC047917]|uniref:MFS transporter n=1 Tax=Streptomyces sp. NPDC047917 TaxID=3365491 RepID=UPI00372024F7
MPTEAIPPAPAQVRKPPAAMAEQPRRGHQLTLLGGLLSADNGESSVVSVLFPALRTALGLPLAALGLLGAVGKLAGMVTAPVWVAVAQRYSRTTVLAVCSGLWGVWTIASGFAQNYVQLLILFGMAAAGVAGGAPLANALLADLYDDRTRGRATGYLYGLAALGSGLAGPLLGLLSDVEDGWRYGFFITGSIQVLFGVLALLFLRDPGVGAGEPQLAAMKRTAGVKRPLSWASVRHLLRNRTLLVMYAQRLTNGQFVLLSFGVTFLVDVRGFSNAQASLVTVPYALAYLVGTLLGGLVTDRVHRRDPRTGRVMMMQIVIVAYGLIGWFATQVAWSSLAVYFALFGVLAALQGCNPGINRPIVMSVVAPELRGAAFALMFSAEAAAWALTMLLVGYLGDAFGLETAFLWIVVLLVLANGALVSFLYRTCPRDAAALTDELDRRAAAGRDDADG